MPGAGLSRGARTALLAGAGGALVALDLALDVRAAGGAPDLQTVLGTLGGGVGLALGIWLRERRPDLRMGLVIALWAYAGALVDIAGLVDGRVAATLYWPLVQSIPCIYAAVVLSYPTGFVIERVERWFVCVAAAVVLASAVPALLYADPRGCGSCTPQTVSLLYAGPRDWTTIGRVFATALTLTGVVFIALLARRVRSSPRGARRTLWPLVVAGCIAAVSFVGAWGSSALGWSTAPWTLYGWVDALAPLIVAAALAAGALATRRARGTVGDLVLTLGRIPPGAVRDALAEALGDPTLELALWLPERGVWTREDGSEVPAAASGAGRATTIVGNGAAALIHDPALADQRSLLEAAGEAVLLSLENHRLHAELRLQLAEVRASRARTVRAADEERRRLERDLHDGAQQRLLGLGIVLQLARARVAEHGADAVPLLDEAERELRAALSELRDLARGIHPAILSEQGLAPAVRTLVQRAPVPVEVAIPGDRFPAAVETTAYFVIAEALANIARHAGAQSGSVSVARHDGIVVVDVRDDGVGGASLADGTGLRGLADRVGALDGRLSLASPRGQGTALTVEIPCES